MDNTLEDLRKLLLGMRLYSKCMMNGVSNEELEERLQMLQNRNCLSDCNLQDLVNVCQLNTQPSQECRDELVSENKEEPCTSYFEKRAEEDCPICLEELDEDSVYIGKCGHMLHEGCLEKYINNKARGEYNCPSCRGEMFKRLTRKPSLIKESQFSFIGPRERPLTVEERMREAHQRALEYQRQNPPLRDNSNRDESDSEEEFKDVVLSENPSVIIRTVDVENGIYNIQINSRILTEGEESMIDDFERDILPLFNEKILDVFEREYRRYLNIMQRMWRETELEEAEQEEPTEEIIRDVITRANRITPSTTINRLNINITFIDFIDKFILGYYMDDEDNDWIEEYATQLQDYENKEKFMALIFLFVPDFINKLEEEQEPEEEESDLDIDLEEESD